MLEMTRPVVDAMTDADPGAFIAAASQEMGSQTLRAHAATLVAQGRTTVEEAMRVSTQAADDSALGEAAALHSAAVV